MDPTRLREMCRAGSFNGPTVGVASGFVQANLVILPQSWAADFEAFCRANPRPCPLLEMTPPGRYVAERMAPGSDLRTDLPRYRVFKHGQCVDRPGDVRTYWPNSAHDGRGPSSDTTGPEQRSLPCPNDPLVAFLLGCSFTFERALLVEGLPVRHIEQGCNVPMYRTNIACTPSGAFEGPLVVSMRPMTPSQAVEAARVTARFPLAHGVPLHVGDPGAIGIGDLARPDYGDAVMIRAGEVPVFWACGVTPFEAILRAKPPLAITHEPGHMFVTDWTDDMIESDA
jgi:uncharacterized protein YcsI (UPF0317 family)